MAGMVVLFAVSLLGMAVMSAVLCAVCKERGATKNCILLREGASEDPRRDLGDELATGARTRVVPMQRSVFPWYRRRENGVMN